jgi:hypothetical protein
LLLISDDKKAMDKYYDSIKELCTSEINLNLLERLKNRYDNAGKTGPEAILADATDASEEEIVLLTDLISKWLRPPDTDEACRKILNNCLILNCDIKIACINEMLEDTNISKEEKTALLREIAAIIEERKKYKNGK